MPRALLLTFLLTSALALGACSPSAPSASSTATQAQVAAITAAADFGDRLLRGSREGMPDSLLRQGHPAQESMTFYPKDHLYTLDYRYALPQTCRDVVLLAQRRVGYTVSIDNTVVDQPEAASQACLEGQATLRIVVRGPKPSTPAPATS